MLKDIWFKKCIYFYIKNLSKVLKNQGVAIKEVKKGKDLFLIKNVCKSRSCWIRKNFYNKLQRFDIFLLVNQLERSLRFSKEFNIQ